MSLRKKFIICALLAFTAFGLTVFGLSKLLAVKVNSYVLNIANNLTKEIGHPVFIERVQTKWDWLFLKIHIKNIQVLDKDSANPIFMAKDIISTVDTINSIRSLGLKFKQLLVSHPRVVMQLNADNMPTILGVSNTVVANDINLDALLQILAMQRRILVENGDFHIQGLKGADLPFMNLRIDFKQIGNDEYSMITRGTIAAAVPPEFVLAVRYFGKLNDYQHAMIDFDLKTNNIQIESLCNFIPNLQQSVTGSIDEFNVLGVIQNGTLRQVISDFNINNIGIDKDTQIKGGIGHINYNPKDNIANLSLSNITLINNNLYSQPLNIDAINTDLIYTATSTGSSVKTANTVVKFIGLELQPQIQAEFNGTGLLNFDFSLESQDALLRHMLVLFPDKKFVQLGDWLKSSLLSGEISKISSHYTANKQYFALEFKDAELKFAQNWPSVHGIWATLEWENGKLAINASRAMLLGHPLNHLVTKYNANSGKAQSCVSIDGVIDTSLQTAMDYLRQTPLAAKFTKLEKYNPKGNMGLELNLDIKIGDDVAVDVAGKMHIQAASLDVVDYKISVADINGDMHFTGNTFDAKKLSMRIFDEKAQGKVFMHPAKQDTLNIIIDTPIKMSSLHNVLPQINFDRVQGATNANIVIELPLSDEKQPKEFSIRSDLHGININYPQPLQKNAQSKLPLYINYVSSAHHDKVKFNLGHLADGILFISNNKVYSGRIALNKKLDNYKAANNLQILGDLKHFNWQEWSFIQPSNDDSLPIDIDISIKKFIFASEEYSPVHIKYNTLSRQLFLDTTIFTGSITTSKDMSNIDIQVEKVQIPQTRSAKNTTLLDYLREKHAKNKLPNVKFNCKKVTFNNRIFKNITLDLLPRSYGYEITNFAINNDHLNLQAQGSWQMDDKSITTMSGNIYTQNFGKVMGEWGYENSISRGKGEMNFSVNWEGGPTDFDIYKLDGAAHLDLRSGSLTNVNPGIGRIIGLLSLESIQRRLQLDFSDILSKGFAFDKLIGDFKIEPNNVMSDNILINSPSAKIELFGKTAIKSQDLDFTMFVTPKVGASLPIAAAIAAGNPAIGAAIWLFDKASGSKISEITKYKYKVKGTWNAPEVNEVSNQLNKVVG